jgi:hypothetical protein
MTSFLATQLWDRPLGRVMGLFMHGLLRGEQAYVLLPARVMSFSDVM